MKPWNTRAEENLLGPFVFAATFIAVSALFIGLMHQTVLEGTAAGDWRELSGYTVIGEVEYVALDPAGGYNASYYVQEFFAWDADANLAFDGDAVGVRDCEVSIVRDNYYYWGWGDYENLYQDFIMVNAEWGWFSSDHVALSYEALYAGHVDGTNQSISYVIVGDQNYSIIITTPGSSDAFAVMLYEDRYNIQVAVLGGWENLAETSMWTVLSQLLTAQLPDVHPVLNILIAVPFWATIGFVAAMVISRFIPLIPGG